LVVHAIFNIFLSWKIRTCKSYVHWKMVSHGFTILDSTKHYDLNEYIFRCLCTSGHCFSTYPGKNATLQAATVHNIIL
jgi:hypothetical protein